MGWVTAVVSLAHARSRGSHRAEVDTVIDPAVAPLGMPEPIGIPSEFEAIDDKIDHKQVPPADVSEAVGPKLVPGAE